MIVEGYSLHLYCEVCTYISDTEEHYRAIGEFGGENKREAWKEAKIFGWRKIGKEVICRDCRKSKKNLKKEEG